MVLVTNNSRKPNNPSHVSLFLDFHQCSFADKPYDTKLEATIPDNVGVINSSVMLNCTANANPPVTAYNIYHNGILVSNASTGVHNITRALAEHNGSYVCVPYNDFGPGERAALNVTFVGQLHEKIWNIISLLKGTSMV